MNFLITLGIFSHHVLIKKFLHSLIFPRHFILIFTFLITNVLPWLMHSCIIPQCCNLILIKQRRLYRSLKDQRIFLFNNAHLQQNWILNVFFIIIYALNGRICCQLKHIEMNNMIIKLGTWIPCMDVIATFFKLKSNQFFCNIKVIIPWKFKSNGKWK